MTINLANNNPRIEYTVAQGVVQTVFTVPFEYFEDADVSIYVDGVKKSLGADYTLSGGDGSTGVLTFITAVAPAVQQITGAVGGSEVSIVRDVALERTTDFAASGYINRVALNTQLDTIVAQVADLDDRVSRSLHLNDSVVGPDMLLTDARKGKIISFNETTGAVETDLTIADFELAVTAVTVATAQAVISTNEATNSATSATESETAKTAAEAARDAALAALDGFDEVYASRSAAQAATVLASTTEISVITGPRVFSYIRNASGTALTTADGAKWSPSGEVYVGHFGAVGDGTTDDTTAIQAAVDYVNLTGSPKRLNFGFSHLITASIAMGSTGGKRMEFIGGDNIAACEIIVNYTGYGSGSTAGAAFQFGDPSTPAYQTAVSINGFLFTKHASIARSPIGIQSASLAQSRIDNVTFGSWSNTAIDLLTPQNVRGHNITTFGGGLSFPNLDTTGITVTQSGTTLTSSASVFSATDVGDTIAIWGTGSSTYRRKAKVTAYTNATTVTVDQSVTDATARRVLFGSPGASMTSGSGTLTSDISCFTTDHVGLTICVRGAGEQGGIYRGKITSYTSATQVGFDTLAETTVSNQEFGAPAMFIWSDPNFGNGASDIRLTELQIENHKGIGLAVSDVDILHVEGKIHSNQTIVSDDDYSISAIWASRWAGTFRGDFDGQYLGEARMVVGELTKGLHIPSLHTRLAYNDTVILVNPVFTGFDGAKVVIGDVATSGGSSTETIRGGLFRDTNGTEFTLNGTFSIGDHTGTLNFSNRSVYSDDAGVVKAEGIQLIASDVMKYYKEGTTFTPTVSDAATAGNLATGTFSGTYTLSGNMITVKMRLANIDTTGMTAGGSLYLGGMPHAIKSGSNNFAVGNCRLNSVTTASYSVAPFLDNNDTSILLYENLSAATSTTIKVSDLSSGVSDIWIDITYEASPANLPT
tara:strand:- start:425 stop:3229 length:2805 start_codon:yes stop_codon:yes gene_type:complete